MIAKESHAWMESSVRRSWVFGGERKRIAGGINQPQTEKQNIKVPEGRNLYVSQSLE